MYTSDYFSVRLAPDARRSLVWEELVRFFKPWLPQDTKQVVELGAAYCTWINKIEAPKRYALDVSEIVRSFVAPGVTPIVGSATHLHFLENSSTDAILMSNLLEHLTTEDATKTLQEVWRTLRPGGRLFILQPNFRFAWREYFDDYTHQTIFTDQGLSELLKTVGFGIIKRWPRLVPFSFKSVRFPVPRFILKIYLRSPWRPLAKQMAIIAEKPNQ